MKQLLKQIQLPQTTTTDTFSSSKLFKEYYDFLEHYTQRQFTVPTDKLPALSGIVQSMHSHIHPNSPTPFEKSYLAGLWREDLIAGLLWHVHPLDETGRFRNPNPNPSTTPQGPSWSWSSLDEEITFIESRSPNDYSIIEKFSAEVVEVDVELKGENPAGEVESGRLVLRGCLKMVFEGGDELERVGLLMGAKMDLPIDDALEIEEMWVLGICAWNDEIMKKDQSSDETSGEEDERSESNESEDNVGKIIGEHGEGIREAEEGTLTQEEEEEGLWSDIEDETDEWATALIIIPIGKNPQEYRRVGLLPMWENSFFLDGEESEVIII
jgi:hypothetical protein